MVWSIFPIETFYAASCSDVEVIPSLYVATPTVCLTRATEGRLLVSSLQAYASCCTWAASSKHPLKRYWYTYHKSKISGSLWSRNRLQSKSIATPARPKYLISIGRVDPRCKESRHALMLRGACNVAACVCSSGCLERGRQITCDGKKNHLRLQKNHLRLFTPNLAYHRSQNALKPSIFPRTGVQITSDYFSVFQKLSNHL